MRSAGSTSTWRSARRGRRRFDASRAMRRYRPRVAGAPAPSLDRPPPQNRGRERVPCNPEIGRAGGSSPVGPPPWRNSRRASRRRPESRHPTPLKSGAPAGPPPWRLVASYRAIGVWSVEVLKVQVVELTPGLAQATKAVRAFANERLRGAGDRARGGPASSTKGDPMLAALSLSNDSRNPPAHHCRGGVRGHYRPPYGAWRPTRDRVPEIVRPRGPRSRWRLRDFRPRRPEPGSRRRRPGDS
jgi:hypothetical protein